jgi:uncharacterized membrane protein YbaN (DUF454 family)
VARSRALRWAFFAGGCVSVVLAALGAALPLLPTTPFLLLAAACFARSSERAHHWLHTNRVFGRYLADYREHRGATVGTKVTAISLVWGGLGLSAYLVQPAPWVLAILAAIGIAVTWHLISLNTLRR